MLNVMIDLLKIIKLSDSNVNGWDLNKLQSLYKAGDPESYKNQEMLI